MISSEDIVLNDIYIHGTLKWEDRERTYVASVIDSIKMRLIHH